MTGIVVLVYLAVAVFELAAAWRILTKAGQPGWAILIPIYNVYVMLKIVGRPWWWLFLYLIPIVNLVITIIVAVDLAKSFGQSPAFAVGLILLSFIFYPILAFGDYRYLGPAAAPWAAVGTMAAPPPIPPAPGTLPPPPGAV